MPENGNEAHRGSIRIVQITDTHLYADADGRLLGLNTRRCLDEVVQSVCASGRPDLVVASGDLTHDGSVPAYHAVRDSFRPIGAPVYCLPGNHDESTALREHMNSDGFHCVRQISIAGWQCLFMDSSIDGEEGGHLSGPELEALDESLAANANTPTLIWLHHQPVTIGSRWLDTMTVDNPEAFFQIVDRYSQVRAIIWGHVHQAFAQARNGVQLLSTPSTCIQFLPGSEEFGVEAIPPGYRWLELHEDGTFETGVERLEQVPGEIDFGAEGY